MGKMELIILTKSSKHHAFCVVGLDLATNKLIRLITNNQETDGALTSREMLLENGSVAEVLDCVEVNVLNHASGKIQKENYLIDTSIKWKFIGKYTIDDVLKLHKTSFEKYIFGSSYCCSPYFLIEKQYSSIVFVTVYYLKVYLVSVNGKVRSKANFIHNGKVYKNFSVTDSTYYNSEKEIKKAALIISIPEKPLDNGEYYKFIARVFELE